MRESEWRELLDGKVVSRKVEVKKKYVVCSLRTKMGSREMCIHNLDRRREETSAQADSRTQKRLLRNRRVVKKARNFLSQVEIRCSRTRKTS